MSNHISYKQNKKLELELRSKWLEWQKKSHLEDQMSFVDYVDELKEYKDLINFASKKDLFMKFKVRKDTFIGEQFVRKGEYIQVTNLPICTNMYEHIELKLRVALDEEDIKKLKKL